MSNSKPPRPRLRSKAMSAPSRRQGKLFFSSASFYIFALFLLNGIVSAQTVTQILTTTAFAATGSASLNAPSRSATGDVTVTRTAAQVTQTIIPDVDLSGAQVPFLLQKPIPTQDDELRSNKVTSRMKDVYFTGCPNDQVNYVDPALRLNISAVYAQFDTDLSGPRVLAAQNSYSAGVLRISAVGATDVEGRTADAQASTPLLSTLSVETQFLTFSIFQNNSYLCDSLYPTSPDPNNTLITPPGCLYGPGLVSLGVGIPLNDTYTLGTLWTRIRLSDTSSPPLDIACFEVYASPYDGKKWYWNLILWFPIALTIGYFVVTVSARVLAAATSRARSFKNKAREGSQPNIIKDTIAPTIIASLSGQQLALSAALLRFATPGCWDIILHTQFVAAMSMVAVRWPEFSYGFFKQAAWSTLVGNVTIIRPSELDSQFNLLRTNATLPEGDLGNQFTNTSSPLYMNARSPNRLMNLDGATAGIDAFAHAVGLRPRDLFGTCLSIWLIILAAVVAISLLAWLIDSFHDTFRRVQKRREDGFNLATANGQTPAAESKELVENDEDQARSSLSRKGGYRFLGNGSGRLIGSSNNTIHFRVLHGNIARAIVLFHLPITIFTTHHMANAASYSVTSVALAALSFSFFSVLIPAYLIFRISRAPTAKLYDSIGTLSALGPLYNTYSPGSQLFCAVDLVHTFILGVVVGTGQGSGTAQAIIILVFEILFALACSLWLPWGDGAMMGPVSFVASILRIITSILVLLLSPLVDFGREPIGWLTYVILLIQAILYVCAALILVVKIIEGLVRLFGRASFDERASPRTSGLGGAYRKIKRRKETLQLGKGGKGKNPGLNRTTSSNTQALLANTGKAGSIGTTSMANSPVPGSPRQMTSSLPGGVNRLPMHSRQASYASYLDSQFYGRKSPAEMIADGNSPYSAYLRTDPNDEGYIMAALPPNVGAGRPVSPPPQWNGRQSPPPATTGFVRTGGGRATDSAPYQALSTSRSSVSGPPSAGAASAPDRMAGGGQFQSMPQRRPRPVSQGGMRDSYYDHRRSLPPMDDPNSLTSTEAAARMSSTKRFSNGHQLMPTASIAGMMVVDEEGQQPPASKSGKKKFWKRKAGEDSDTDDDDDDGSAPFRSQGGWRGLNKMSAAMTALAARLGGKSGVAEEANTSLDPPSSEAGGATKSGGFEVVRAQRPRRSNAAAEKALDSTALAAASASAPLAKHASSSSSKEPQPQPQRLNSGAPAASYSMPLYEGARPLLPGPVSASQDLDLSSGTLPPGAAEQAPLLPRHSIPRPHAFATSSDSRPSQNEAQQRRPDEDMFWVSSRPPSQLSLASHALAAEAMSRAETRDSRQLVSTSSSVGRIAEPMQAEVLNAEDSEGNTPPADTAATALSGSSKPLGEQFFDADGNFNSDALTFDHPLTSQASSSSKPQPQTSTQHQQSLPLSSSSSSQPPIWDSARAYRS